MPTPVRVLLFAGAREAAGRGEIRWAVPADGVDVAELLDRLITDHPKLRAVVAHARFVRNGEYLTGRRGHLDPGDEFAIHPPYSGG